MGPLDRWLQPARAGAEPESEQPTSSNSANDEEPRGDQNTAPPAAHSNGQQRVPAGPLLAFLSKSSAGEACQRNGATLEAVHKAQRRSGFILDRQVSSSMDPCAAALLHHRHAATFRQLAMLETHACQRPVLGSTAPLSLDEAGCIQSASFDSQGELLVACSEEGLLTVHSTGQLIAAASAAGSGGAAPGLQQHVGTADPLLVLDTNLPKLQAVRWNPADENVVGVVSSAARQLHLYDLQHTQGQPKQVLAVPQQTASALGLSDLAFFAGSSSRDMGTSSSSSGGGYVLLASGMGGQVFLWDARAKAQPSATLHAAQCGAIYSLQLEGSGHVVLGGTQSGEVKAWDLRGGSSSTMRFGGTVHHHPLLASVNLRHALAAVPGLARQTAVPASAVHSMQLDPCDPRRLAFHLACGWSGVLCMEGGGGSTVTHLHAPAHTYPESQAAAAGGAAPLDGGTGAGPVPSAVQMLLLASTAAPGLRRRACWTADGRRFCVPSRRDDSLLLLDFAACPEAGCYALRSDDDDAEYHAGGSSGNTTSGGSDSKPAWEVPPAARVPLSHAAVCVAAHPSRDVLVAGSMNSCLAVAGLV